MSKVSIKRYIIRRWGIFSDSTTLHGVREINRAPNNILKGLWLFIVTISGIMMFFQIYKLADHYLTEPVTTTVGQRKDPYPAPLLLFVAFTRDLFPPCANSGTDPDPLRKCPFPEHSSVSSWSDKELDYETLAYARSLVDARVHVPNERNYNYTRAKEKFDQRLQKSAIGPKPTYFDLLKPYMIDITPWINNAGQPDPKFKVLQRSLWSIASYYIIEPASGPNISDLYHDVQLEAQFNWHNLSLARRDKPGWVTFVMTSYGLLTDAVRFEPGRIMKMRFEIQAHRQAPLRRQSCKQNLIRYRIYDDQKCNETCYLKAEHKWMPRTCYVHKEYSWGFYEMYKTLRPCSFGIHFLDPNGTSRQRPLGQEPSLFLPGGNREKMKQEYERCLAEECVKACEQLEMKLEVSSREFSFELGNKSLVYATWPAVNAVTVYEVGLQYTWDGFVGQLGGLVGLWMGASMMSVCEGLYLCCCCCYDVRGGKSSSRRVSAHSRRRSSSTNNGTGMYRNTSRDRRERDEETRYGSEYCNGNGNIYTNNVNHADELQKLRTATVNWTENETEKTENNYSSVI